MSKFLKDWDFNEIVIDPSGEEYTHLTEVKVYARTEDQDNCVQVIVNC